MRDAAGSGRRRAARDGGARVAGRHAGQGADGAPCGRAGARGRPVRRPRRRPRGPNRSHRAWGSGAALGRCPGIAPRALPCARSWLLPPERLRFARASLPARGRRASRSLPAATGDNEALAPPLARTRRRPPRPRPRRRARGAPARSLRRRRPVARASEQRWSDRPRDERDRRRGARRHRAGSHCRSASAAFGSAMSATGP